MPQGDKDMGRKRGINTRFTGENAAEMGRRGNAVRRANIPIRKCLKNIASEALYGAPQISNEQKKQIAKFYKINPSEVTNAHLAIYKQTLEMGKGDANALNIVAGYAGEKPTENVTITTGSFDALNDAFEALKGDDAE